MLDDFLKSLFLIVPIAFTVFIVYMVQRRKKQWKQAAYEIAMSFGCTDGEKSKNWTNDQMIYEWESHGIKWMVSGGAQLAGFGSNQTIVTTGAVSVIFPRPFPFEFHIRKGRSKLTGDPDFDKNCHVETKQTEMAKQFLQDPSLRSAIRALTKSMTRQVEINQEGIYAQFFEVKEFKDWALKTIQLGNRLSGMSSPLTQ